MKKTLLVIFILLSHFYSFCQPIFIKNPAISNPRPQISKDQIIKGKLRDFNHLKTDNNTSQKPTGTAQRMVASSATFSYDGVTTVVDSAQYIYSGTRGSLPNSITGNVTSTSLFDSSFYSLPEFSASQGNHFFTSYVYNNNNSVAKYNAYDSTKTLVFEERITYFANDSLSSAKSINTTNNHSVIQTREILYNSGGQITKDSDMITFINTSIPNDSEYIVRKVYFDNFGRIDYTDSIYSRLISSTWQMGSRVIIKNVYNTAGSVLPDKDTVITIITAMPVGIADTLQVLMDDYHYDLTNKIIDKTVSQRMPASAPQPGFMPLIKEIFSYNNAGQILTWISQVPSNNTWVDNLKESYEYEQNINTLYTYSVYSGSAWIETFKSISMLDENNIIDSIKTYQNNTYEHLTTISVNSFKNITHENDFSIINNSVFFSSTLNYYYDEYDDPTSIISTKPDNLNLSLFPIPATNVLHYRIDDAGARNFVVNIIDLSGKLLYRNNTEMETGKLDISNLKAGQYIFEFTNMENGSVLRKKFIKE